MRNISTALLSELSKNSYTSALIIALGGYGSVTSWTTSVGGAEPRGVKPGRISYGTSNVIDSFSCSFDDTDRAMYLAHKYSSPSKTEVKEYSINVQLAAINPDTSSIIGYSVIFSGNYSEWNYSPQSFSIKAVSDLDRMKMPSGRISSSSCLVKVFKDSQCRYTGSATWCDRTAARCHALNNTANFRGFRWLPTLANKQIRFSV